MKVRYTTIISALIFLTFLGFAGLENYLILSALAIVLFVGVSKCDLNRTVMLLFTILLNQQRYRPAPNPLAHQ